MNRAELLQMPVDSLPVSEAFKHAIHKQDIKTLAEIVNIPITELVNLKWFTNEMLSELSELLFEPSNINNNGKAAENN